ncbi:HD-GYP domain-containing protein [Clostridium swellfunianum]|uniref:HD-GYP domain-containing protein n=1 Tax=Clostridium swellfunianum TaxID=1367462 RepID=UPI002548977F|nr:HD-GYP domain-containing protein [Clostridium swellfunianum]
MKKLLYVHELVPGMISTKEIVANGTVLIGKGVPITKFAIGKLRENYIYNKVEIYYEDNSEHSNVKTVEDVEQNFNEIAFDIKRVFENMDALKLSEIEEVRRFAARIQDELKSVSAVIKNIVLYGSGGDIIYRHGVNVAALSTILGKWIGLGGAELNLLTYASILHDFGKTKIDKNILNKPDSLDDNEYKQIKSHSVIGYNYVKEIPFLDKSVSYGVLMHHERLDGSGYPLGLKDTQIHQFARIIAIADVFDAVNSDRIYKKRKSPFEALEIIKKESLGKLDYEFCSIFLNHIINYYVGESVLLNGKKICKIIKIDLNDLMRPLLLDDCGFIDLKNNKDLYIEALVN